jgi:hypothetical protein
VKSVRSFVARLRAVWNVALQRKGLTFTLSECTFSADSKYDNDIVPTFLDFELLLIKVGANLVGHPVY